MNATDPTRRLVTEATLTDLAAGPISEATGQAVEQAKTEFADHFQAQTDLATAAAQSAQDAAALVDAPAGAAVAAAIGPGGAAESVLNAQTVQAAERGGRFNVLDYGATTAASDNTEAFQAAESAARTAGGTLYIPSGRFRVAAPIDVATSVQCDGVVLIDSGSTGRFNIVRTLPAVTITRSGLTGLTAGSGTVGGLGERMGDLYLSSTEHLIERNNGTAGQHYTKSEISKVVNTAGAVSPPIKTTYDSNTTVEAILYPTEPALDLGTLTIEVDGSAAEADDFAYLVILRSDVKADDLRITNTSGVDLTNAVVVRQATNIEFNRPAIHGFKKAGTGYGIATYNTADVRLNDPRITGCRHATSGLWMKDTYIDRGTSEGGLDSHWAWGFYVNQHNSTVDAAYSHVLAAGADVVVTGGTFTGGRNLLGIRSDTPEMGGTFAVQGDWEWTPSADASTKWIMGYSTPNLPTFDHGRTLRSPVLGTLSGGRVNIASGAILYGVYEAGADFAHENWGTITVDGTKITPGGIFIAVNADRNPDAHPGATVGTHVSMYDVTFTGAGDSLLISDKGDTGSGPAWTAAVRDCFGFYLKLPERGMSSVTVDRTEVKRVFRAAVSASPQDIGLTFRDSTLQAVSFNGTHWADFSRCTWKGAAVSTALGMDLRVKSYLSNLHATGATGHPTHPDGYRDTTYYKAA